MNTSRILVASSNSDRRGELRAALEFEGHDVSEAATGAETIEEASSGRHDALVLDTRGDSDIDWVTPHELCREIRQTSDLGIIVVDRDEREQGPIDVLNAGADDYVTAPFVLAELQARVRAILRRVPRAIEKSHEVVLQDRAIDLRSHKIKGPGDRVIHLTPKEFLVLKQLVSNANKPLTHQSLAQSVWQRDAGSEFEYVRIVIKQLRRKLEPDPDNPRYIRTERAVGYRFDLAPLSLIEKPLPHGRGSVLTRGPEPVA
jgi:two-component system KDP operon response regulator KdpE